MPKSRIGESTYIDKITNEVKGRTSGKIYGKGTNLQEALAIQTQTSSGGTPGVSGRPDLLAIKPTATEEVKQITSPTGEMITPRVATPAELQQRSENTLESFNKATAPVAPVIPLTPEAPALTPPPVEQKKFESIIDATKAFTQLGAEKAKSDLLGAPDDYDNQIIRQKAALLTKLFGQDLTPDDLKWLTPGQSSAVTSNDKKLIEAELAGLNTITLGRKELKAEEETKALKQYELFAKSGISPDELPEGFLSSLDATIGLPEGTYKAIYTSDYAANQLEKQNAAIDSAVKVSEYLDTIPLGQTVTIGNSTYVGTDIGKLEVNDLTGDVYALREDPNSSTGFSVTNIGNVGSQKGRELIKQYNSETGSYDWWSIDPNNPSDARPVTQGGFGGASSGGVNTYAVQEDFPPGEGFSATSWCVEYARQIAEEGSLPSTGELDTIAQKRDYVDPSITTSTVQPGDWILTNEDSTWGHMALVTGIQTDPSGKRVAVLNESNYVKGKVTYNRTIALDDSNLESSGGKILGFHHAQLKDKYSSQSQGEALVAEPADTNNTFTTTKEQSLFGKFEGNQVVQDFTEVQNKAQTFQSIIDAGVGGPGDLALVYEFMKALDPNSVVKEAEYASAAKSGNIFLGTYARFNGYLKEEGGLLPDNVKSAFMDIVDVKLTQREKEFTNVYDQYRAMAERQGLNPDNVVVDYRLSVEDKNQTEEVVFNDIKGLIDSKKINITEDEARQIAKDAQQLINEGKLSKSQIITLVRQELGLE